MAKHQSDGILIVIRIGVCHSHVGMLCFLASKVSPCAPFTERIHFFVGQKIPAGLFGRPSVTSRKLIAFVTGFHSELIIVFIQEHYL